MHKSIQTAGLLIAAIGITVIAYNDVLSKDSVKLSDNENTRIFSAFIEKASTDKNSSIIIQSNQNGVGRVGSQQQTSNRKQSLTDLEGTAPLSVIFDTRRLPHDVISYDWSFGDGDVANGARVSHTFQSQGTYLVTLKTLEKTGPVRLEKVKIKVSEPPTQHGEK